MPTSLPPTSQRPIQKLASLFTSTRSPAATSVQKREGLPVLPGALPLVGHVPWLYFCAPEVLREAQQQLGPVFWVSLGFGGWQVACTNPEGFELLKSRHTTNA